MDRASSKVAHIGLALCSCGHPVAEHADSGWGPNTVCAQELDDPNDGWDGVCPCVIREESERR